MCAGARFTYLPGRTRRRAAASRPRSQRRRARRRRPREPSGQTRRPRVRSRQHAQGDGRDGGTRRARLACSKTLCRPPSAAESWFRPSGGDSNEIASRRGGRCFAVCSPIRGTVTCRGYTWRASGALITPESSPAAPSRPAPYAWDPRSRDGGGAARPPGGHPGASERRERPSSRLSLTSQTAGSPSRWTILQLCHSMDSFSLFRLETVEKLEDLKFKMSPAFYYPHVTPSTIPGRGTYFSYNPWTGYLLLAVL